MRTAVSCRLLWALLWLAAIGRLAANENGTDLTDLEDDDLSEDVEAEEGDSYSSLDESRFVITYFKVLVRILNISSCAGKLSKALFSPLFQKLFA
jgi:hypothetical protein